MLTLCDARLAYIYTYLSAILCMNKLSKTASVIYIHFQSILEFICRKISQIQTIQFLGKRALWHFRHKQGLRLLLKFFKKIYHLAQSYLMSNRHITISALIICDRRYAVKLAMLFLSLKKIKHTLNKVINVKKLQLTCSVVYGIRLVISHAVAKC